MSEKFFIPKNINETPSSREKFEETETDLDNLKKGFKINPESSDEMLEMFLEVRRGLEKEKKDMVDQAHGEAIEEDRTRRIVSPTARKIVSMHFSKVQADHKLNKNSDRYLNPEFFNNINAFVLLANKAAKGEIDGGEAMLAMGIDDEAYSDPQCYAILADLLQKEANVVRATAWTKEKSDAFNDKITTMDAMEAIRQRIKGLPEAELDAEYEQVKEYRYFISKGKEIDEKLGIHRNG
jgi:hypothetical protein